MRRLSLITDSPPADLRAAAAADAFLWSVEHSGRSNELQLVRRFKIQTKTWFELIFLGIIMLLKGKLKLFSNKIRRPKIIAKIVRHYMAERGHKG
jgi:hypothetical protein